MPNSNVTYTGGASGSDPVPPTLSKNYVYSDVCNIVRLLAHESGNTTVLTNSELLAIVLDVVGQVQKENWQVMQPCYLQSNTFTTTYSGGLNIYKSSFASLTPYLDKIVCAIYLYGSERIPIKMMSPDELQRANKMPLMYANSVVGTQFSDYLELYIGGFTVDGQDYLTEIYYYRQPVLSGITTSNYTTKYVDTALARTNVFVVLPLIVTSERFSESVTMSFTFTHPLVTDELLCQ